MFFGIFFNKNATHCVFLKWMKITNHERYNEMYIPYTNHWQIVSDE